MAPQAINVSNDITHVSDLVMLRQILDVPREQVEALVRMVLDCAAEAAEAAPGQQAADLHRVSGLVDRVEDTGDRLRVFLAVAKEHPHDSDSRAAVTPGVTSVEGQRLSSRLKSLVGQRVMLGVRHEPAPERPGWKILVVHEVEPEHR